MLLTHTEFDACLTQSETHLIKDQFAEVLRLWRQHLRTLWKREENSPANTRWLHLLGRRMALMALGCGLLGLEVPILNVCSNFIATKPGVQANAVFLILMVWNLVCLILLSLPNLSIAWHFFSRWDLDLSESTAAAYDRDRPFVEVLAKNSRIELSGIGRRLKAAVESREKLSRGAGALRRRSFLLEPGSDLQ